MTRTLVAFGLALLVAPATPARRQHPATGCLTYVPDTVSLKGTLRRHTFPGPPNYESIKDGDEPETGFYLHLGQPVCTIGKDEVDVAARGVRFVQLVLDSTGYGGLRPLLGRQVTLRGTLFHAISGHHHAPLLLTVLTPVTAQ